MRLIINSNTHTHTTHIYELYEKQTKKNKAKFKI